jgi:RimJ/RimL family protein N-acetyltransferase
MSWNWLNDPEIKHLTDTPSFTKEDQIAWFQGLRTRNDYKVWGVQLRERQIGVVGLKNICKVSAEFFGYIGEKELWGRGLGAEMLAYAERQSVALGISVMFLKVLADNSRANRLYESAAFVNLGTVSGRIWMAKLIKGSK